MSHVPAPLLTIEEFDAAYPTKPQIPLILDAELPPIPPPPPLVRCNRYDNFDDDDIVNDIDNVINVVNDPVIDNDTVIIIVVAFDFDLDGL